MIMQMKIKLSITKKWSYILDHPNRIIIIGGSRSGKTNALLNLIENQPNIIKYICMLRIPMR